MDFNFEKLCLKPDEITMMIYHDKCIDGFTSAFCCYLYFKNKGKSIKYIKGSFDDDLPKVDNENVLICDFSYKKNDMAYLLKKSNKLIIIDHHKSAEEELINIPEENKFFNSNYSGAYLAWKYFFKDKEIPDVIRYVQDNDLWKKELDSTKEIISYINMLPFDFIEYEKLLDNNYLKEKKIEGGKMNEKNSIYINKKMNEAHIIFIQVDDKYYFVPHVQSYTNKSEIGHILNEKNKNIDFCVIYSYDKEKDKTFFSLRSNENNMDTTIISKKYMGGGHRNASGFILEKNHNHIPGIILDKNIHKQLNNVVIKYIDINNIKVPIVTLNCSSQKDKIGKYLLQIRDYNLHKLQQCSYIFKNTKNILIEDHIKISIIWHERKDNKTYLVSAICLDEILDIFLKFLDEKHIEYNIRNKIINFVLPIGNDMINLFMY